MKFIITTVLVFLASQSFAQMDSVGAKESSNSLLSKDSSEKTGAPADSTVHVRSHFWDNVGLEGSSADWGIVLQVAFIIDKESISLRGSGIEDRNPPNDYHDYFSGITLQYGRQLYGDHFMGRMALGAGYFDGFIKGTAIYTFGGQFEGDAIWQITEFSQFGDIGLGLSGTVSAGPKFFVPAIALGFYFGNLK